MSRLPSHRSGMLRAGGALCAVALLLLPLAARSARSLPSDEALKPIEFGSPPPPATPFPHVYVERDPFEAPPGAWRETEGSRARAIVRAVASGARPAALVEEDGRTQLVSIGDRIDGIAVIAIDASGLVFADGTRLQIEKARP